MDHTGIREMLQAEGKLLDHLEYRQFKLEAWELDEGAFLEYYFVLVDEADSVLDHLEMWQETDGEGFCWGSYEKNKYAYESGYRLRINRETWEGNYACICRDTNTFEDLEEKACMDKILATDNVYAIIGEDKYTYITEAYEIYPEGKLVHIDSSMIVTIGIHCAGLDMLDRVPKEHLKVLKESVYAQKGMTIEDPDIHERFSKHEWYNPRHEKNDDRLDMKDKELLTYLEQLGVN